VNDYVAPIMLDALAVLPPLTEAQSRATRVGMYFPRLASDPPFRSDRCARRIGNRQCDAYAKVRHPSGYMVCKTHERAGCSHPFPRG
jgi:hypothetical protein